MDNFFHDLITFGGQTGSFLSFYSYEDADFYSSPFSIEIILKSEIKLFKREVYTLLNMIGDIGGLFDGLFIVLGLVIGSYNASKFELSLV
jgi:hypothetical protein